MVSFKALAQVAAAGSAAATSILLPLYVYPTATAWNPVYSAITANPTVQFQIVVNPNSGPGAANSYPNSDYITAISKLNSYKNVEVIGYVPVNYTNRAYASVTQDVKTYAGWANRKPENISVNGIFFDEAPYQTGAPLTYMANASNYTYNTIQTSDTSIVFNPGTNATDIQYFNYAETIIEFENYYSNYKNQSTINGFPSGYKGQSAVVVHDYNGSNATLQSLVHTGIINKLGSMYFTTDCCYNSLSFLGTLAAAFTKG